MRQNVEWNFSILPYRIYDEFVTRNFNGDVIGSHLFPYFFSQASKSAVMSRDAVPVQSRWDRIGTRILNIFHPTLISSKPHPPPLKASAAVFDAKPFQSSPHPLRSRSIFDTLAKYHVEASEGCLRHYDNDLSLVAAFDGWINPTVRAD